MGEPKMGEPKRIDWTGCKRIEVRDVADALAAGAAAILVRADCAVSAAACKLLQQNGVHLTVEPTAPAENSTGLPEIYRTPEAEAIKDEICAAGRKLWLRQYVDGNGGNISCRIGPDAVLCTPTMISKYDMTPDDVCLTDLEGNQLAGPKPRTSEMLLHLEIYKAVPEAKAVVHCHPPHATAYAITDLVPPNLVIPEFEVLVGKVAITHYETPGTQTFAETILPAIRQHNVMLLANHGIVCWADTITHAEWCAEVLDTYCWTLMNARLLGAPISYMSERQGADLAEIRKKLGLPDAVAAKAETK